MTTFEPSNLKFPLYVLFISLPFAFFYHRYLSGSSTPATTRSEEAYSKDKPLKTIMQPPREDLAPPKDDPFTLEQLKEFDGSDASKPIYVAIKGKIFTQMYTFF